MSFKVQLFQKLKLRDCHNDSQAVFYTQLSQYCNRQRGTHFEIRMSKTELTASLYKHKYDDLSKIPIPKNYPWGASNMETQAYYQPRNEKAVNASKQQALIFAKKEFNAFKLLFVKLSEIENFHVILQD